VQDRFIINEFTKYKDFHSSVKLHLQSKWHRDSTNRANNFCNILENNKKSVIQLMNSAQQQTIE